MVGACWNALLAYRLYAWSKLATPASDRKAPLCRRSPVPGPATRPSALGPPSAVSHVRRRGPPGGCSAASNQHANELLDLASLVAAKCNLLTPFPFTWKSPACASGAALFVPNSDVNVDPATLSSCSVGRGSKGEVPVPWAAKSSRSSGGSSSKEGIDRVRDWRL